jgi:NADPH-dependent curcumin reductase CurA
MSVDPYMQGRMNDGKSYVPPFELGKQIECGAIGEVIESGAREFKPGDAVTSNLGWREYFSSTTTPCQGSSRFGMPLPPAAPTFGGEHLITVGLYPISRSEPWA